MNIDDVGEIKIKTPARAIMVNREDNVAVVLSEIQPGEQVTVGAGWNVVALQSIPPGHKMAVGVVEPGQSVIKFGAVVGRATRRILPGEHIHFHNIEAI